MEMLTKIITGLDDVVAISKNLAINEIYGASKNRIFNLGEDKYNRKLGGYYSGQRKLTPLTYQCRKVWSVTSINLKKLKGDTKGLKTAQLSENTPFP